MVDHVRVFAFLSLRADARLPHVRRDLTSRGLAVGESFEMEHQDFGEAAVVSFGR
jgi:hypothetical protein